MKVKKYNLCIIHIVGQVLIACKQQHESVISMFKKKTFHMMFFYANNFIYIKNNVKIQECTKFKKIQLNQLSYIFKYLCKRSKDIQLIV